MTLGLGAPSGVVGWLVMGLLCVGVTALALVGVARLFPSPTPPSADRRPPDPGTGRGGPGVSRRAG